MRGDRCNLYPIARKFVKKASQVPVRPLLIGRQGLAGLPFPLSLPGESPIQQKAIVP